MEENRDWCNYSNLPSPLAYQQDTDYDGMGNQGRFPSSAQTKSNIIKSIMIMFFILCGITLSAQSFRYTITQKFKDTEVTKCGGFIKYKIKEKDNEYGFAEGRIVFVADNFKVRGKTISTPYMGVEFFDISVTRKRENVRIIMNEGLFGVFVGDSLHSFYDTIKEDRK